MVQESVLPVPAYTPPNSSEIVILQISLLLGPAPERCPYDYSGENVRDNHICH